MAAIIKMNSKEFVGKFVDEYDHNDFLVVIVSDEIGLKKKSKYGDHVYKLNTLIPPSNAWSEIVVRDSKKRFAEKYLKYLTYEEPLKTIAVMVKVAMVDKKNVIVLCSKSESESGMLDVLGKYIEKVFGFKTCTFKEFRKNPKKYNNKANKTQIIKNLDRVVKGYGTSIGRMEVQVDPKKMLEKMPKDKLKALAKKNKIKLKKDMSRKDIIKKILSKMK